MLNLVQITYRLFFERKKASIVLLIRFNVNPIVGIPSVTILFKT